jgi:D-alanine--D-alanine ligase
LFGGQSAEHDVSCVSARHVLAAANPDRYSVEPVGITRDGQWVRAESAAKALAAGVAAMPERLDAAGPDETLPALIERARRDGEQIVVLPLLHGPMGEDGTVQGLLELAGVPYVGAGVLGSAVAMDKIAAKDLLAAHDIPQARYRGLHASEITPTTAAELVDALGLPLFVKPANLGSSVGITKALTLGDVGPALAFAASYDEWIVVEEGLTVREIEVAVMGTSTEPRVSVPGEIRPGSDFYDYADKYESDAAELIVPAVLSADATESLNDLALRTWRALRLEGMARIDFFLTAEDRVLVNEANTIPGFTPISMYPRLWQASGVSYPDLIDALVDLALARHARRARRTDR